MEKVCFQCGDKGDDLYGYTVCADCKSKLGLFTDATIKKHIALYQDPAKKRSYAQEIKYRLDFVEKDYIKKKLKLLHILDRLDHI